MNFNSYDKKSRAGIFESPPQSTRPTSIMLGEQPNSISLNEQPNSISVNEQPNSISLGEQPNSISITESPNSITLGVTYGTFEIFTAQRMGWNAVLSNRPDLGLAIRDAYRATSDTNIGAVACTEGIGIDELSPVTEEITLFSGSSSMKILGFYPLAAMLYGRPSDDHWLEVTDNLTTYINSEGRIDEALLWKDLTSFKFSFTRVAGGSEILFPDFPWFCNVRSLILNDYDNDYFSANFLTWMQRNPASFLYETSLVPVILSSSETKLTYHPQDTLINSHRLRERVVVATYMSSGDYCRVGYENEALGGSFDISGTPSTPFPDPEEKNIFVYRNDSEGIMAQDAVIPSIAREGDFLYFGYPFKAFFVDDNTKKNVTISLKTVIPPTPKNEVLRHTHYNNNPSQEISNHASVGLLRNSISTIQDDSSSNYIEKNPFAFLQKTIYEHAALSSPVFSHKFAISTDHTLYLLESSCAEADFFIPVLEDRTGSSNIQVLPINAFHGYADDNSYVQGTPVYVNTINSAGNSFTVQMITAFDKKYIFKIEKLSASGGYGYVSDIVSDYPVLKIFPIHENKPIFQSNQLPGTSLLSNASLHRNIYTKTANEYGSKKILRGHLVQDEKFFEAKRNDIRFNPVLSASFPITISDTYFGHSLAMLLSENEGHVVKGFSIPLVNPSLSPTVLRAEGAEFRLKAAGARSLLDNTMISLPRHYRAWIVSDTDKPYTDEDMITYFSPAIPHSLGVIPSSPITANSNWQAIPPEANKIYGFDPILSDLVIADKVLIGKDKSLCVFNNHLYLSSNSAPMTPNLDQKILPYSGEYYLLNNYIFCSSEEVTHIYHIDESTGLKNLGSLSGEVCANPISTLGGSVVPIYLSKTKTFMFYGIQEKGLHILYKKKVASFGGAYSHFIDDGSAVVTLLDGTKNEINYTIDNQMGISASERIGNPANSFISINSAGNDRLLVIEGGDLNAYVREFQDPNYTLLRFHDFTPPHREGMEFHTKTLTLYFEKMQAYDVAAVFIQADDTQWASVMRYTDHRVVIHLPDRVIDSLRIDLLLFNNDAAPIDPQLEIGGNSYLDLIGDLTGNTQHLVSSILTRVEFVGYYNQSILGGNDA